MSLNVEQMSLLIKEQIKSYKEEVKLIEEGWVISIADGIVWARGLNQAMNGELVFFPKAQISGMVLNLEEDVVGIILIGDISTIKEGDVIHRSKKIIYTVVGNALKGRIVNALGQAIDGKGDIKSEQYASIEQLAPEVMMRQSVSKPLETGILAIDAMIPIGKGQRELIIGDRQTGKTTIAIDSIINQKGKNVSCVYVAIGQKASTVSYVIEKLTQNGALDYTTVVVAGASDPAPLQYLAPYSGITIAEAFMKNGEDVLIVYDDLSKHAIAYRTISLLLRRPPGREAYPGDIFYLHARLLERAAKLNEQYGGGSITALPIVETQAGDISAYIPTNIISITDGQIFLSPELFNAGLRPAVDVGFSVSRVGSAAQIQAIKQVTANLKLELAQYSELQAFAQFGADLDETSKKVIEHGLRINELLKQNQNTPFSQIEQALILLAIKKRYIQWLPVEKMAGLRDEILTQLHKNVVAKQLVQKLTKAQAFDEATMQAAEMMLANVVDSMTNKMKDYDYKMFGNYDQFLSFSKKVKAYKKINPDVKKTSLKVQAKE